MAEDIFGNMSNMNIDELGSSLLQRKADRERRAAKKAKKNERIQQGLAVLLMGQGIMKSQLKQRIKEVDKEYKFENLNAEDKARKLNVNATILNTIGNQWDGKGGYEGFKDSEDYLGFSQAVRPFIDQKIKAMTSDEYDTIYGTSTYENAINLATEGYAQKYLEIDPVSKKANYLAYEDGLRELIDDPEINLDRNELFQRAMGLDADTLTMYKKRNYENILTTYKSQGNLMGGFRRVLSLFNDDFKNKSGFDIFKKFDERTLAGPTIRDLNQAMNLKGMTNNIVSKALADASKSPTRWRERASGKKFENYRKDIGEIYLPQMTNLLDEGRYPSELQTDTFIGKRNWDEFMRDISDEDRRDLILDTAALSLRLKEDRKFLMSVYNETEGKKVDGKSFNEFRAILDNESNRTMFAAMIVTDAGFRDESWIPVKQETYDSFGTLNQVYNKYNISTMVGDDINIKKNGGIDLSESYINASVDRKKDMIESTVKDILTNSKTENERNIKLGGALDIEINKYFGMDSQAYIESLAAKEMEGIQTPVTLEEKMQKRIDELPEQTPAGAFLTGDSREQQIKFQETAKDNKEKRQNFRKKKNTLIREIRNLSEDKTLPITRNLFTLPSEKDDLEIKDENARYVTDLITEKYNIDTNPNNLQRLSFDITSVLENNPEAYNEIMDIIKNKNNREYLESLKDEKKKTELNSNYENPEYNKLLNLHLDRLGIDSKELATRNLNELSDFILEVESDGDFNAANPNSSARGGYQFIKGSVVPAVNRLEKYLGPLPRFDEVRKTGDVRSLSPEDQTLLFMADILEKKGSDKLINKFLNADNKKDKQNAAYEIYTVLHHTTDKKGNIPFRAKVQTKFKLRKYFNE
tara:strand:+ start:4407 stop:7010 length:2604 start_codon:yes stop_codon:yes gene_type:complete